MKETKLLGTLLPSHPDLTPIIQVIREKYNLPEISPDDDTIKEVFLNDEIVPLEEFRQDIENRIREGLVFLSPDMVKLYTASKALTEMQGIKEFELLPDNLKSPMETFFSFIKTLVKPIFQTLNAQFKSIADILYFYLLTGESEEAPSDWFSKVATLDVMGDPMVIATAGQLVNPDVIVQQFREEYKKTFGAYHPKITETAISTAYYLRLKKDGKPWKYLVEEYIRLNKLELPRNKTSKKYSDTHRRYEQRLKKQIQRTQDIFDVLVRDIN